MEKIPTFIEFKKEAQTNPAKGWTDDKCAVEFAKLHVEAVLKEIEIQRCTHHYPPIHFINKTKLIEKIK